MSDDRHRLLLEADQAARRGDLAAAAVCYRKLLAFTPTDLTLLQRLGDALARASQDAEARDVMLRLSEEYWRGGFRSRSLAVLRRASRLGGPQPDLLVLLGERTLELGHVADAREPLIEAASLREAGGDIPGAILIFRQVAEALPRDLASRQALLRLAQRGNAPQSVAEARLEIAMATALNGDTPAAIKGLRDAVSEYADSSACLARLPHLLKIFPHGIAAEFQTQPARLTAHAADTWGVIAAAFLAREGQTTQARSVLAPVLEPRPDRAPRIALWAGRVLLDLGEIDLARRLVLAAAADITDAGQENSPDLVDVLTGLVARNPNDHEAATVLIGLTSKSSSPALVDRPNPVAQQPDSPLVIPELPQEVRVALTEAQSLIQHGLPSQARVTLQAIEASWKGHPEISRLEREALIAEAKVPRRATPPSKPRSSSTEEMFVVIEDDDGGLTEIQPTTTSRPTHAPFVTGPLSTQASPGSTGSELAPDVKQMAVHIQNAIGDEDHETLYQMAIGLLEMGLEEQALETLERARLAPGRAVEVALLLLQHRTARGEGALAIEAGESVLDDAAAMSAAVYADFLAALALATHQAGGEQKAVRYLRSLEEVFPDHPALDSLRGAIVTKF